MTMTHWNNGRKWYLSITWSCCCCQCDWMNVVSLFTRLDCHSEKSFSSLLHELGQERRCWMKNDTHREKERKSLVCQSTLSTTDACSLSFNSFRSRRRELKANVIQYTIYRMQQAERRGGGRKRRNRLSEGIIISQKDATSKKSVLTRLLSSPCLSQSQSACWNKLTDNDTLSTLNIHRRIFTDTPRQSVTVILFVLRIWMREREVPLSSVIKGSIR